MESSGFNAEPVVPLTPNEVAFADQSQKVDDVEKAQVMAEAGNQVRGFAAKAREEADTLFSRDHAKRAGSRQAAGWSDEAADKIESKAGEEFDLESKKEIKE